MVKDIEYVANLNLQGNEIKNVVVEQVDTQPTTDALGKKGRIVTYLGDLYVSDGSNFSKLGSSGDVTSLTARISAVETKNESQDTAIGNNSTAISGLGTRMTNAETAIDTNKADIATNKADIATLDGRMDSAETDIDALQTTVGDAESGLVKKVADNTAAITLKANSADVYTKTEINSQVSEINTAIGKKADADTVYTKTEINSTLAGYYTKTETMSKTEIESAISTASTSVYKVKGSVATYEELPASGNKEGDVYNVVAAHGTTPAGTNYVWDGAAWDPLGGTIDLSTYATKAELSSEVSALNTSIGTKVDQTAYNNKMTSLDGSISTLTSTTEGLRTDVDKKVDTTTYEAKVEEIEDAIDTKASKVGTGAGTWTGQITVNSEGIVTAGKNLTAEDIPTITSAKVSDFATAVKGVRYKSSITTDQTTYTFNHGLGVEWPHVTVYNTTSQAIIYADVVYTDENTVTVSGNIALGSITVVISP